MRQYDKKKGTYTLGPFLWYNSCKGDGTVSEYVNPTCPTCGIRKLQLNYYSKKDGRPLFKKRCWVCNGTRERRHSQRAIGEYDPHPKGRTKYEQSVSKRKRTKLTCDKCGFKAIDTCQLDIDHIDGNHANNDIPNLQILCANCHRLKTKLNNEGPYKVKR